MSSDETAKIEPTLSAKDGLAASEKPSAIDAKSIDAKSKGETAKLESVLAEAKADDPLIETKTPEITAAAQTDGALKLEPTIEAPKNEAPSPPPVPQIDPIVIAFKKPEPVSESVAPPAAPRSTRFALLAASVAIAASFGAIGGSLGAAKLGPILVSTPAPAAPVAKEQVAEEVRALKDNVAQLRATNRALMENFAALKATVTTASTQNTKIAETLERIEKAQTEQRKLALSAPATIPAHVASTAAATTTSTTQAAPPQAAPEVTGSIPQKPAVPLVLGTPPSTLKPPTVAGFVLRRVYDGAALIESRDGMIEVEPGIVAPGLGRIEAIKREDGRWIVVTARGIVR
jgi:hypothetical protein